MATSSDSRRSRLYAAVGSGEPLRSGSSRAWSRHKSAPRRAFALDVSRHPETYIAREQFPKRPWFMFFGFSQYLAALIAVMSLPFAVDCSNPSPGLRVAEIVASLLWLAALCAQTVAKGSVRRLLADRNAVSRTSDPNLSRYTLPSHYFSEWLVWFAYFLFNSRLTVGLGNVLCSADRLLFADNSERSLPRPPTPFSSPAKAPPPQARQRQRCSFFRK